jgi:hypothetical protein
VRRARLLAGRTDDLLRLPLRLLAAALVFGEKRIRLRPQALRLVELGADAPAARVETLDDLPEGAEPPAIPGR